MGPDHLMRLSHTTCQRVTMLLSVANEVGPTAFQSGPFEVYVTQFGPMRIVAVQRGARTTLPRSERADQAPGGRRSRSYPSMSVPTQIIRAGQRAGLNSRWADLPGNGQLLCVCCRIIL